MNLVIEIIAYFCECMTRLLCIHAFAGKKIKFDVKTVAFIVTYVLTLTIIMNFNFSGAWTFITLLFILVYLLIEFKTNLTQSIVLIVLDLLAGVSMQVIATVPIYLLFEWIKNQSIIGILINAVALLLMFGFTHFVRINKLYIKLIKWDKTIISILGLCCTLFLYLLVKFKIKETLEVVSYFISGIMACIVIVIVFNWQRDRYIIKQKSLELRMHEIYGKTFEGMIENIRIRQHDYKNQLAAIYGMHLTANSFEELVESQKKYCDNLEREGRFDSILTSCKDKILAGFLYTKFMECEKIEIQMNFEISVNDAKCRLATYELIEVIGILLDNAVEYEIEHKKGKEIYFRLTDYGDKLNIVCRNKVDDISLDKINDFFKKGYSTKGENRGLGLYNVKKTLEGNGEIYVSKEQIEGSNWLEFNIEVCK